MPDDCITVYSTAGRKEGRAQPTGEIQEQYGIQIRLRSSDYEEGYEKLSTIVEALDKSVYGETVVIDAERYRVQSMSRQGAILELGKETPGKSDRRIFTVNYTATITDET